MISYGWLLRVNILYRISYTPFHEFSGGRDQAYEYERVRGRRGVWYTRCLRSNAFSVTPMFRTNKLSPAWKNIAW